MSAVEWKVGDRVRVGRDETIVALRGRKGAITEVGEDKCAVTVDSYGTRFTFRSNELLRVTPADELRDEATEQAQKQAFDEGKTCEHCNGDGKVPGGDKLIHVVSPAGFGADWRVEAVADAIREATEVKWGESSFYSGHDLFVKIDGKWWTFGVKKPAEVKA